MQHWIKRYVKHNAPYHFYTCTLLDTENGCTIHNQNKPHICTGFPFYNRPVKKTLLYSPNCGYFKEIQEVEQMKGIEEMSKQKGNKLSIDMEECKRREESLTDGQIMDELNDEFDMLVQNMVHDDGTIPMATNIKENCEQLVVLANELRSRMIRRGTDE